MKLLFLDPFPQNKVACALSSFTGRIKCSFDRSALNSRILKTGEVYHAMNALECSLFSSCL